jgi:hypothetical protein
MEGSWSFCGNHGLQSKAGVGWKKIYPSQQQYCEVMKVYGKESTDTVVIEASSRYLVHFIPATVMKSVFIRKLCLPETKLLATL